MQCAAQMGKHCAQAQGIDHMAGKIVNPRKFWTPIPRLRGSNIAGRMTD